jgi:acyl dehydratase
VAGDTVTVSSRIADLYDKKNGALEFIEIESQAVNQHGTPVARLRSVTVVRH